MILDRTAQQTCYNCGLQGHFSQNCPNPRKENQYIQADYNYQIPAPYKESRSPSLYSPSYASSTTVDENEEALRNDELEILH
jgi:hypothetical protein